MIALAALSAKVLLNLVALSGRAVPKVEKVLLGAFSSGFIFAQLASENFAAHSNQNPINTNWKLFPTVPGPPPPTISMGQILNGQFVGQNGASADMVYDGGITWPNDQYSQGTLATFNPNKGSAILFLRGNPANGNGYAMGIRSLGGGGFGVPSQLYVDALVNEFYDTVVVPQAGDVWTFGVIGNQLSVFQNSTLILTVAADNSAVSGKPGIASEVPDGVAGDVGWSSWAAGGLVGGPPSGMQQIPNTVLNLLSSASDQNRICALGAKQTLKIATLGATVIH